MVDQMFQLAISAQPVFPSPAALEIRPGDLAPIDFCGSVISLRIFDDRVTVKQVVLSGDWPRGLVAAWGYQLCRLLRECRCGRPVAPR